ncbi:MAG TPA: FG-GAP-like repeat-containing protein [Pyrinomonadaceae bacterium]|nr:FG-GAP-like repeat-containing protein [Pyrinomonadaceae bacterium]
MVATIINTAIVKAQGETCNPFSFNLAPDYRNSQRINAFGTADLNNDGFVDVVTTNQTTQSLSFFYGDGSGGFAPPQTLSLGTQVISVLTLADMNHDGRIDIIGASSGGNFNTNKITVLLNTGQGGFSAPVITDLPNNVIEFYYLKTGDFNGDGHPDLAAVTRTNFNIFPGNGLGQFSLAATLPWDGNKSGIAVGKFNGDNITDIAVTSAGSSATWQIGIVAGNSGNSFSFNNFYNLTGQPLGLETADFNRDGNADLIVSENYPYSNNTPQTRFLEIWNGSGSGAFTAGTKVQYPVGTQFIPMDLTTGDFNDDGNADVAVNFNTVVAVNYGAGNGTFRSQKFWATPYAQSIASADLNQDNKKDLLTLSNFSLYGAINTLINKGNEKFSAPEAVLGGKRFIAAPDMNNDNYPDSVTANSYEVLVGLNDQLESFLPASNLGAWDNMTGIKSGDFNADGNDDLITIHSSGARIAISFGNGGGGIDEPVLTPFPATISGFIVGKFNGDQKDDVFITDNNGKGYSLLSNGDGTFTTAPNFPVTLPNAFTRLTSGDFNNDNKIDLVITSGSTVKVWLGDGTGQFTATAATIPIVDFVVAGDWNGDGNLDLAGYFNGTITRVLGDGNGGFGGAATQTVVVATPYPNLISADFNLDGFDDIAYLIGDNSRGNLVIVPSSNQAPYGSTPLFYWIESPTISDLIAVDYNLDNKIDIGYTSQTRTRAVLFNTAGAQPCISISDVTVTEGDSGSANADFTVSLSSASTKDVYVNYTLEGQTAVIGTDIANASGRLKIPAGQTSANISVAVNGDVIDEFDENFVIHLTSPLNAALLKADGAGTILDNDAEPTITITDVTQAEGGASQSFNFNVTLSSPSGKPISFRYTTADGTAIAPRDYNAANNVVNIAPGTAAVNIGVLVFGDNIYESNEDFFVNLSEQVNVSFADSQGKGTITNDDPIPTVSLFTGVVTEGDTGTVNSTVTVQLSNPTYLPVTLNILTSDGTAVSGRDYVASDTPLTIPAEQQSATTAVQIIGDTINEPNETFNVNVYNVTNATVSTPQFTVFITDDEWVSNDFDRDGKTDVVVFRPSDRTWYFNFSSNNTTSASLYGLSDDIPVSGDYSGDGRTDIAVFRPANGVWYTPIANRTQQFGLSGDIPVHGDYDNDGRIDVAVFRPSNQTWYIQRSSNGAVNIVQWGLATDTPVPADYDGDGKTDVAVFRPETGVWYILRSTDGGYSATSFGQTGDKAVPADYDGDGKADIAVFRAGVWYVSRSSDLSVTIFQWGNAGDKPVPGNYDGDDRTDFAVYRNGTWWIWLSSTNTYVTKQFGLADDIPIPFVSNN